MQSQLALPALFAWPLVVYVLFRRLPRPEALVWSILGGYLLLPFGVGIDPPLLPVFDKTLIPALSALVMCLLKVQPAPQLRQGTAMRRRPGDAAGGAEAAEPGGPARGPGPGPDRTPGRKHLPRRDRLVNAMLVVLVLTPFLTVLWNPEPVFTGARVLPSLRPYDAFSMILGSVTGILPFLLARRYLAGDAEQALLLRILCVAGLLYSLPTLFEIRMSPQLSRWVYGFLAQSFGQVVRDGGYRPVVFLQHGLWLAIFTATTALAGFALWRERRGKGRSLRWLLAGLWMSGVLSLSHSLGALILLILLAPAILLLSRRGQLLSASLIALAILTFPMLRGADLVPTERLVNMASAISPNRAQSLEFRFENEDKLLAHAREKPLAGWGAWGRSRVYDTDTGADISTTDGMWVIVLGVSGWLGYLSTFGLLTVPIFLLTLRSRQLGPTLASSGLCLVLAANLLDLIPNATLTPVTWLIAGSLAGRCRVSVLSAAPQALRRAAPARREREPVRAATARQSMPADTVP